MASAAATTQPLDPDHTGSLAATRFFLCWEFPIEPQARRAIGYAGTDKLKFFHNRSVGPAWLIV
jgi:hypothetical protein